MVLHLLIILIWASALKWNLFATSHESPLDNEPLVFELQEQNRPQQVVEVPEDADHPKRRSSRRSCRDFLDGGAPCDPAM